MNITRTIKTKTVTAIYYSPEKMREVSEDVTIIGDCSDDEVTKILTKRKPLFISYEVKDEKEEIYGMTAEDFIAHHTFTKQVKEKKENE